MDNRFNDNDHKAHANGSPIGSGAPETFAWRKLTYGILEAVCWIPLEHYLLMKLGPRFVIRKGSHQEIRDHADIDITICFQPDPSVAAHCANFY